MNTLIHQLYIVREFRKQRASDPGLRYALRLAERNLMRRLRREAAKGMYELPRERARSI